MKTTFDYLETVAMNVTVCDKEGIVLYQNARSRSFDGDVVGQNLFNCHNEQSGKMIRHMLETGQSNTMESIRHGKRKLYHRTPWYDDAGQVAGLFEFGIDLPEKYPVIDYDKLGQEH